MQLILARGGAAGRITLRKQPVMISGVSVVSSGSFAIFRMFARVI
jgi:hypothetical protein